MGHDDLTATVRKQKHKNSFCIFAVTVDVRALIMKTDFHLSLHNIELALVIACQNVSSVCLCVTSRVITARCGLKMH